ncbi:MAG: DUF421 domain-containing protein [Firmicutes bacterium]|nr:DUF421 domain-containing protein [Bacillota bacterium]
MKLVVDIGKLFLQTALLYFLVLVVFRLMGKRTLGNLAPFDIAVIIMVGEAAMIPIAEEKVPLIRGIIPILSLGFLQILLTVINMYSRGFEKATQGTSTILVKNGQILAENLRRERVTLADLSIGLREKEVENLSDVREARLEPTGQISVIKEKSAQPVTPGDVNLLTMMRLDAILEENVQRLRSEMAGFLRELETSRTRAAGEKAAHPLDKGQVH